MNKELSELIREYRDKYNSSFDYSWFRNPEKFRKYAESLESVEYVVNPRTFEHVVQVENSGRLRLLRKIINDYIIWESDDEVWINIRDTVGDRTKVLRQEYSIVRDKHDRLCIMLGGEWVEVNIPIENSYT